MMGESFRKVKNPKIVRKKKRSSVRGYESEKLFSLLLKKKSKSDLRIN